MTKTQKELLEKLTERQEIKKKEQDLKGALQNLEGVDLNRKSCDHLLSVLLVIRTGKLKLGQDHALDQCKKIIDVIKKRINGCIGPDFDEIEKELSQIEETIDQITEAVRKERSHRSEFKKIIKLLNKGKAEEAQNLFYNKPEEYWSYREVDGFHLHADIVRLQEKLYEEQCEKEAQQLVA